MKRLLLCLAWAGALSGCSMPPPPAVSLVSVGVRWRVSNVGVAVRCRMSNRGPQPASASLLATLYDSQGQLVGTAEGGVFQVPPGQSREGDLWSNDTPQRTVARVVCSARPSAL